MDFRPFISCSEPDISHFLTCRNARLSGIWSVRHQNKKRGDVGPVRYRNKGTQSGTRMIRYEIEMLDARMPMPAEWALLPMPCYTVFTFTSSPQMCPARKEGGSKGINQIISTFLDNLQQMV